MSWRGTGPIRTRSGLNDQRWLNAAQYCRGDSCGSGNSWTHRLGGGAIIAAPTCEIAVAEKGSPAKTTGTGLGKGSERAVTVEVAIARGAANSTDIRAIGGLQSDESAQSATEIAGRIAESSLTEGGTVNAGDLLVELDDALAQAEVADAQARYDLASANNDRAKELSRTGNVTEKAIDEATANFEIARAALELPRVRWQSTSSRRRSRAASASARCRLAPSSPSACRS